MGRQDIAVQPTLFATSGTVLPGRLPTNLTTRKHPVHRWCNFIAGFSPEFVQGRIQEAGLGAGATLLDPFSGMATALVAANALGLDAVGFEAQPFFYDIGHAKVSTRALRQAEEAHAQLAGVTEPAGDWSDDWSESCLTFLQKLVPEDVLPLLGTARHRIKDCSPDARPIFRLLLSRMLEMAAGSQTDGIYKAPTTKKRSIGYADSLPLVYRQVVEDLAVGQFDGWGSSRIIPQSSESMDGIEPGTVDICVTSPPYLNNFDFAEMARMELYFWGYADSWATITQQVRSRLIINTTTAPTGMRKAQDAWAAELTPEFRGAVDGVRRELTEQKRSRPGKKEYDTLVYPYFAQMRRVLGETKRVLRPEGNLHLVVADAALYGVHIHTQDLLAQIMTEVGFEVKEIIRLRDRGGRWILDKRQGSSSPLGEFHIHAVAPGA